MATGVAAGIGTVDLVGIRPDLSSTVVPTCVAAAALISVRFAPPTWPTLRPVRVAVGLLGLWTAWGMVSAATSSQPMLALVTAVAFALLLAAGLGVGQRLGSTGALIVAGSALTLHALASIAVAFTSESDQFPIRLRLVELEATHLAQVLALGLLVGFLWLLEHPTRSWFPILALGAVCTLGLVLTGSRTTPVALVVAGALALVALRRWRLVIGGGVALACLFAGLVATGADARIVSLTNRTSSELTNLDGANGRTTLWPEVLDAVGEHPVVGIGLGVDRDRMAEINAASGLTWNPQHAHNLVLHVALTTGWPGAVMVSLAVVIAVGTALRSRLPWLAAFGGFVLVVGVSEPVLRTPQLVWALLAVALAFAPGASRSEREAEPSRVGPVVVSAAVLLMLGIGLVWLEPGQYPHRYRCRDDAALDASGLLLDVDGTTGEVRTPRGVTTVTSPAPSPEGLVFGFNEPGASLPDTTARSVRCGAIRGEGVTVVIDVATTDLRTEGPGRILSISSGTEWDQIDLMVGQEADGLAIRVRSSRDHRNDEVLPGAFVDTAVHRLTIAIGPDVVRVWRDGELFATWDADLRTVAFDDWRIGRATTLGNEVTNDRPFAGVVESVQIYEGVRAPDELPE